MNNAKKKLSMHKFVKAYVNMFLLNIDSISLFFKIAATLCNWLIIIR